MLILSALDVDEKTIIEDYVLSNAYNADSIAKKRAKLEKTGRMSPESIEKYLIAFESVDSSNMSGAIAFLKEKYGSVKDYIITGLGVSEADMLRLKEKFLG
jgi:protein-tyrosine phosphatase